MSTVNISTVNMSTVNMSTVLSNARQKPRKSLEKAQQKPGKSHMAYDKPYDCEVPRHRVTVSLGHRGIYACEGSIYTQYI